MMNQRLITLVAGSIVALVMLIASIGPTYAGAALQILTGPQGGTGIGTTTAGNIGLCLSVASVNPLIYTFGACSGGGGGGGSFPFTATTNYGQQVYATTTPTLWLKAGIFASSTSHFDQLDVGSSTASTMATSTIFGNFLIKGTSSSTALIVSNSPNGPLSTDSNGNVSASTTGLVTAGTGISLDSSARRVFGGGVAITNSGVISLGNGTGINCSGTNPGSCSLVTPVSYANGGTGTTTAVQGQLRYMGATADQAVATGTLSGSGGVSVTAGTSIIGANSTVSCASCALFGWEWTAASNYGVNTNSTTTPIWLKGATGGLIGLAASSTSYFDQINVGSTTLGTMATSTFNGNLVVNGIASTTKFYATGLKICQAGNVLTYDGAGTFGCAVDSTGGGGSFPFAADNTYGQVVYSTSTPTLWFKSGFFASSTSYFGNGGAGSSTIQMGPDGYTWTLGYFGLNNNFVIASSTALIVSPALTIDKNLKTTLVNASSTAMSANSAAFGATATTSISTAGVITTPVISALLITNGSGAVSGYGGSANCTNQVVNGISALGVGNCVTVTNSMLTSASVTINTSGSLTGGGAVALGSSLNLVGAVEFSPATNYAVNTNATTTPVWFKGAVGGVIGLAASSTSYFDQINIGSSTASTMATSTDFGNFAVSGNASSTRLMISGIPSCSGSSALNTNSAGTVSCGAITGFSTFGYDFTPATNYGVNTNSTTTPIWLKGATGGLIGFAASSTSYFDQLKVGSSTVGTMATSTFYGNVEILGNASSTNLFVKTTASTSALVISGITGTQCLHTTGNGVVAGTGSDCGAGGGGPGIADPFAHLANFGTTLASATTSPMWMQNYFFASSTSYLTTVFHASSTAPQAYFFDQSANAGWYVRNSSGNFYIGTSSQTAIPFATSTTPALSFVAGTGMFGNLGLGTSSPWSGFTIDGGGLVVTQYVPATSTSMTIDGKTGVANEGWRDDYDFRMLSTAFTITLQNFYPGQKQTIDICNGNATAGAITWAGVQWDATSTPAQNVTANKCQTWFFRATYGTTTVKIIGYSASIGF